MFWNSIITHLLKKRFAPKYLLLARKLLVHNFALLIAKTKLEERKQTHRETCRIEPDRLTAFPLKLYVYCK